MRVQHNVPLASYTSLHAGGNAQILIELEDGENLQQIVAGSQAPLWVLGYGTNILVSNKGLNGTVIFNKSGSISVLENGQIRASSGANWDELVQKAIENNLWVSFYLEQLGSWF
jgi:UDP-N-acetylmuramate dehydrogenase